MIARARQNDRPRRGRTNCQGLLAGAGGSGRPKSGVAAGRAGGQSQTNNLWFRLAQGMAEFRAGHSEPAINGSSRSWLETNSTQRPWQDTFTSMAHHRLKDLEAARRALTVANARFDAFLQQGLLTEPGSEQWWFDPAASLALRLEAEKTVLGQPVSAIPTVHLTRCCAQSLVDSADQSCPDAERGKPAGN